MDELLLLQKELNDVQNSDTSHKLSERNCVDLVLKLISMKKVNIIGYILYILHLEQCLVLENMLHLNN